MNIVPEKLTKFQIYNDDNALLGIADGNFPSLEFQTSEIKGAGLVGTIDSPGRGGFSSIVVTLNWRITTPEFMALAAPKGHNLDMYAEHLYMDAGAGEYVSKQFHIYMRAFTKKLDMGELADMDSQGASTEHEVYYIKVEIDGKEHIEIDKYNYIYKVDGTDYLEDMRHALAMN
ncbi:MAG: phage major tail tube protein [Synergistaceae bacterium]|nr:phage major tail tube protein [Synergistaceae bacterium]